jgi:hypothetical protein
MQGKPQGEKALFRKVKWLILKEISALKIFAGKAAARWLMEHHRRSLSPASGGSAERSEAQGEM